MAKDTRHRTTLGNWFRFAIRFLGLSGVIAAAAGAFVLFSTAPAIPENLDGVWPFVKSTAQPALEGSRGSGQQLAGFAFLCGLAATVLWLAVEALGVLFLVTGRRTLTGTSSTLQVALGLFLLVAVNVYSFSNYLRLDLTRQREFTLPATVANELRRLNPESPTTIVVFEKHQTFATIAGKQDSYDTAADAKVVEKVRDLVDQFRDLGGRFTVVTLDINDKRFDQQLAEATKTLPKLKSAILAAPESSIFFAAGDRVQRLGFSDFLQLDKSGSKDANSGKGNLVLRPQGIESFARRVLAIQEKRPKVALAVIHEVLTSQASDEDEDQFTSAGFKKALEENGFDVTDIVLKRWDTPGQPPAAYVLTESKLERLESELKMSQDDLSDARAELQRFQPVIDRLSAVKGKSYEERNALYRQMFGRSLTTEQEAEVLNSINRRVSRIQKALPDLEKELAEASDRVEALSADERAIEGKRQQDLKAKFAKLLSDVDLLVLPRLTVLNATSGSSVPPNLYRLSPDQATVVKDFMKAGKPVMVCAGPITNQVDREPNETEDAYQKKLEASLAGLSDDVEKLLGERGIELGQDLVMFNTETKAFAARQAGQQFGRGKVEIPPLRYEAASTTTGSLKENPVGAALRNTSRSIGQSLDLTLRSLRPVYMSRPWQNRVPFVAEFLATSPDSWNEKRPFPELIPRGDGTAVLYLPKYDAGLDDTKEGDIGVERRGPFPVGLAVSSKLPTFWYNDRLANERLVMLNFWRDADRVALPTEKKPMESEDAQRFAARLLSFNLSGSPLGNAALAAAVIANADEPAMNEPDSRLVVLGHGGVFTGPTLKPANEKVLLHSVNWLLDRTDRMPRGDNATWQYPRVNLSDRQFALWRWGTFLGLPMIAIYAGLIVLMIRKVR